MTGHREIPDPVSPLSHPAASAEKDCVPTGGLAELDRAAPMAGWFPRGP